MIARTSSSGIEDSARTSPLDPLGDPVGDPVGDPLEWVVDGNNVFGSRPDGWWNDRPAAQRRFAQCVAEWCRTHDRTVTLVFDAPLADETRVLAGGNLSIVEARRRGRDAADDEIVDLVDDLLAEDREPCVVTSDKGLRRRLPGVVRVVGAGAFRDRIGY